MTLPSSPPLSLNQILGEFGAPAGTGLTSLYRGGAYVPNTGANAGVPTSGAISILSFLGASATPATAVNVFDMTASSFAISPTDSAAGYQLTSSGLIQSLNNGSPSNEGTWLISGVASGFDVFATLSSGTLSSGTTGSWLNLGTTRTWVCTRTSNLAGTTTAVIVVQIRDASTLAVLDTATITLAATVDV